jgi:hypothetical protein
MKRLDWTLVAAAGVLALGTSAVAEDMPCCEKQCCDEGCESASDLSDASAPLVAGSKIEAHAAMDSHDMADPKGPQGLRRWLGLEPREADRYDDFSRPVTNVNFHHPFIWNEIRPLLMYHSFPETSVLDGGHLKLYAVQAFFKLTDEIQFMAYKDGWVDFKSGVFKDDDGFADIALGLKIKLWEELDDEKEKAIFSVGVGYEFTNGDDEVLEGEGDGFFDVFASYAREMGDLNFIGTGGVFLPRDGDEDNRTYHWHLHLDTNLTDNLQPLIEINGFYYDSDAERNAGLGPTVPLGIEGFDYTTLGADDVRGNNVITGAVGFRHHISEDISWGLAYEKPITSRKDVMSKRWTMDIVLRF